MRIVIAGAGEMGLHLTKLLSKEAQDIYLIDTDKRRLQYAESHYDVITIRGDASTVRVLREANIAKADLLIAATNSGNSNVAIALMGKRLGAGQTIARVSDPEVLEYADELGLKELGIDSVISPEALACDEIYSLMEQAGSTEAFDFEGGKLRLVGMHLNEDSALIGRTIEQLAAHAGDLKFVTVAIDRDGRTIIPRKNTEIQRGDRAYFVAPPEGIEQLNELIGKKEVDINNIMILGGSRIGITAAKRLSKKHRVKLIERDREKCYELTDLLPDVLIVNGDATNVEMLEEENVGKMDAFLAVTGHAETNILSCLVAKDHGIKRSIALVENMDFIHLSKNIGIDTLINKKHLAASHIFTYIRKGSVVASTNLLGMQAEVLEFVVKPNARITRSIIAQLDFPRSAIIGGVIRNDVGMKALGDFQILPNDRVVVFCLPDSIDKVSSFFK